MRDNREVQSLSSISDLKRKTEDAIPPRRVAGIQERLPKEACMGVLRTAYIRHAYQASLLKIKCSNPDLNDLATKLHRKQTRKRIYLRRGPNILVVIP
jgi:hypothetical protein